MSPIKATTLEERRAICRRREKRESERYANGRISEEEEVATYFSICPLFAAGLLGLEEAHFMDLMLRTRKFMLDRQRDYLRSETEIETCRRWKA
jgi:hypothetical protein